MTSYISSKNKILVQDSSIVFNDLTILYSGSSSRFKFSIGEDEYTVKISRDILTLYNGNKVIDTLLKEYTHEQQSSLDKYLITQDMYVSINREGTIIIINDEELQVTKTYKNGTSNVYETSAGILSISNNLIRNSTWNGIAIMKI